MGRAGDLARYKERCFNDFEFMLDRGEFKISSAAKGNLGLINATMEGWPIQRAIHEDTERQMKERGFVRTIICKSRKRGCSTWIQLKSKHVEISTPGIHSLTVAHERAATETVFRIGKTVAEHMDPNIARVKGKPRGQIIEWENGSYSQCMTQGGSVDSFRGFTPFFLHISELPSWETGRVNSNATDVAQALLNAVPDRLGYVYIESTAKGVGNLFHTMWEDAYFKRRGNLYVPLFFPWTVDADCRLPAHTEKLRKREWAVHARMMEAYRAKDGIGFADLAAELEYTQLERERAVEYGLNPEQVRFWQTTMVNKCGSDQDKFDEEWPMSAELAFVSSGRNVFNGSLIRDLMAKAEKTVKVTEGTFNEHGHFEVGDGHWQLYEKPIKGEMYIIAADAAGGGKSKSDDYSCIQVLRRRERVQVAEFYGKVYPDQLAAQIAHASAYYKAHIVAPECNGPGLLVVDTLAKHYEGVPLYRRHRRAGEVSSSHSNLLGYATDQRTRPYMMGLLEGALRRGTFTVFSLRLLGELQRIIRTKTGRIEAPHDGNDDAAITAAIALDVDQGLSEQGVQPYEPISAAEYGYGEELGELHSPFTDAVDLEAQQLDQPTYEVQWDWN